LHGIERAEAGLRGNLSPEDLYSSEELIHFVNKRYDIETLEAE